MEQLRKLRRLSWDERWLLARAFVLVASIRVALRLFPFRILRPVLARATFGAAPRRRSRPRAVERVPWAVALAAAYVPGSTCLVQALAAQILLVRYGEASKLQIGVAREQRAGVRAHAWVEHGGKVVIGNSPLGDWALDDFLPLFGLEEPKSRTRSSVTTVTQTEV
jgi:hypothetical protein